MVPMAMGFGNPTELAIIAGVVVLLFGGSKIANFGKSMGEGIRGFKKAVNDDDQLQVKPVETMMKSE